jgi:hypothetical protein
LEVVWIGRIIGIIALSLGFWVGLKRALHWGKVKCEKCAAWIDKKDNLKVTSPETRELVCPKCGHHQKKSSSKK